MAFTGNIAEIPLGAEGLTGSKNLALVRPTQLIKARNLTYENGTLQKEGGTAKYTPAALAGAPTIIGGWDWWPSDGVQRAVIVTSAGDYLKDVGAGTFPTTLVAGLSVGDVVPVFVEAGKEAAAQTRKLFLFTGKNAVRVLSADGATASIVSTPPADWAAGNQPITGVLHRDRVWGAGNLNDPHRWYYTDPDNHENYTGTGSGTVAVYPGEGERIIAGCSFKGLLITWKRPAGIYYVDTTDPTIANWGVRRISRDIGIASPLAFAMTDTDVVFWDQNGNVHVLSAVQEFGSLATRAISDVAELAPFIRENTNDTQYLKVRGIFYAAKRRVEFAVAKAGASINNARLVLDLTNPQIPRFAFNDLAVCESLWLRKDTDNIPKPVAGDNAGIVRRLDQETRSHDGAGYAGEFQIPNLDLSHLEPTLATLRKAGRFLELVVEPKGNWNLNVDVLWDGTIKQTLTYNLGQTGAGLDTFVLDTDVLAGDQVLNRKRRIVGTGRRFSALGRNNGAGQDFSVARMLLHFVPETERT